MTQARYTGLHYKLKLKNNSDQVATYIDVLRVIQVLLHRFVGNVHRDIVDSLVVETKAQGYLRNIDLYNLSEKQKIINLFEAVISFGELSGDRKTLLDSIDILINFKSNPEVARSIRTEVISHFHDTLTIIEETLIKEACADELQIEIGEEEQPLSPAPLEETPSKTPRFRIRELYILIMACFPVGAVFIFLVLKAEFAYPQNINELVNTTILPDPAALTTSQAQLRFVNYVNSLELKHEKHTISTTVASNLEGITDSALLPQGFSNTETKVTPQSEPEHAPEINEKKPTFTFKVNSWDDCREYIRIAPAGRTIIAGVFIEDATKWPCHVNFTSAQRVQKLYIGGDIYFACLLHTFSQMPNVTFLFISNRSGNLCRWNEGYGVSFLDNKYPLVYLNQTRKLTLERFGSTSSSSCTDVYLGIAQKIKTPNLQLFALKKGVIDDRNIILIQRTLKNNWKTLTHLKFQQTFMSASTPFFGRKMTGVLRNVYSAFLDYLSDYVSWEFCLALPNLKVLSSRMGYLQENQLMQLSECNSLKKLMTSVKLVKSTTFDTTVFSSGFQNITTLNVTLIHESCEDSANTNVLHLRGLNTLKENIRNFTVMSKCKLAIHPESGTLNNPHRQESRSKSSRGHYSFSYDFKEGLQDVSNQNILKRK